MSHDNDPRPGRSGEFRDTSWWRRAAVYQVYPRSFADSNGDGVGDINGIRSRMAYLADLGIDAIWVCPWYQSPLRDGGYDVSDFRRIHPRLGTLADAEQMIDAARDHRIRVIVDLVPNHVSSDHAWFIEALDNPPGSTARERFHFRSGTGADGAEPPNNWPSIFGGSAWNQTADGEWYLHLFDRSQPDLNWDDDDVGDEFDDIIEFWLARGVDGFRIDVAQGMAKDPDYPDVEPGDGLLGMAPGIEHPYWNRPGTHAIARRWRRLLDAHDRDVMMIAEAWVDTDRLPSYLHDDEYHQSFNFDFLAMRWDGTDARAAIDRALLAARTTAAAPTWMLSNHDVMRPATRFGLPHHTDLTTWPVTGPAELLDADLGLRRARATALLLMALPGSVYLYQGEELGLPEVWDLPVDALTDPIWENSGHRQRGRDGCRVPLPWTTDRPSHGFSSHPGWLPQPDRFSEHAVSQQTGRDNSTLELYRAALAIRRAHLTSDERFEWLDTDNDILAFRRGTGVVCVVNFGNEATPSPTRGRLLIASESTTTATIAPSSAVWFAE